MILSFRTFTVAAAILVIQGCGVGNDRDAGLYAMCETDGVAFGTGTYWRCRAAADQDRKENQLAAFYMLMGAFQDVSNRQATEIERFRNMQDASSANPIDYE